YQWTQVSGPNTATIGNATQASASLSGLIAGTYNFRLTVRDNDGATDTDDVTVTVNPAPVVNQAPVANAGNNITITLPTSTATLNGTGSSDADGTIASYQWTQVSGPNTATIGNATSASASLSGLIAGTYNFRLTVRDNDGATDTDEVTVTVNPVPNQAPVANAGNNITITLPTSTATLNGTGSSDADGTIASYQWTQVSGPNTAGITANNQASTNVTGLIEGVYSFQLSIRDNDGGVSSDLVTITVNPAPNKAPIANAGANIRITLPVNTANLNGSGSSDADGTIASYQWTQLSGPTTVTIANSTRATASVSGLVEGIYSFRLTIRDNDGASATANVSVTVSSAVNQLPIADAGSNITITLPVNTASLNGTGSSDPDGTIASYQWSQVSGPNTATMVNDDQAIAALSNLTQGTYSFRLTVIDNRGGSATETVNVIVNATPNRSPVANAGNAVSITLPINSVSANGNKSTDPDGTIVSYQWSQVSGPNTAVIANGNKSTATFSGLVKGIYSFRLIVKDDKGASSSATLSVTVNAAANLAPIANAGTSQAITLSTNEATLNGSLSKDPDGSIKNYQWQQLSGPVNAIISSNASSITTVTGFKEGDYVFQLTVRDNLNATAKDTVQIAVVNNFRSFAGGLMLYPNPATDKINFNYYSEEYNKAQINIYDVTGRKVMASIEVASSLNLFKTEINIGHLKPGVYLFEAIMNNKEKIGAKFLKQ
ncbi:PKD domain-containing protein, partial [Terrimonas pollutisoli]|uniref:PKD domain-containing protein n=1 Tax=Terrimonas pollutisoli TaxID=3034147 RepID=UPI0023EB4137